MAIRTQRLATHKEAVAESRKATLVNIEKLADKGFHVEISRFVCIERGDDAVESRYRLVVNNRLKTMLMSNVPWIQGITDADGMDLVDQHEPLAHMLARARKPAYITIATAWHGKKKVGTAASVCSPEDARDRIRGEIRAIGADIAVNRLAAIAK